LRLGLHTSTSGSLEKAGIRAAEVGANTMQIFSSSPRMWRPSTPDPAGIRALNKLREKHDIHPLVIHDSYLINLCCADDNIRSMSVTAFRGEIERALQIGADYLVAHPGNHRGRTVEEGMLGIVESLALAAQGIESDKLTILLENTAGAANSVGSRFEELAVIWQFAQERMSIPMGFCIDTCHCFVSGRYDVSTAEGLKETVRAAETILGIENIRVIHANDAKAALGSRLDRHEHIGQGKIGEEGFRRILTHPKLRTKPFILETPHDEFGDERSNLDKLKALSQPVHARNASYSHRNRRPI
jgi:deoxyribonuclease-4